MMNRGVMDRQLFRNGGAAFPDLSGDGRVTQRDILMGRGVIPMQQGGNAALEAGVNAATEAFIMTVGRPPESLEELRAFAEGAQGYNFSGLSPDNLPSQSEIVPIDPSYLGPMVGDMVSGPRSTDQIPQSEFGGLGRALTLEDFRRALEDSQGRNLDPGIYVTPPSGISRTLDPGIYVTPPRNDGPRPVSKEYSPDGSFVIRRQEGGPAMVMPSDMASMAQQMPAAAAAMSPPEQEVVMGAMQASGGPEVQQMIASEAQSYGDPETAQSYEEMMNMVRGDQATVEERRSELAMLVGDEDAMQTPESVLALVQPIVQLSMVEEAMAPGDNVDAGVGALAAQQMTTPIQGDMAGGVMTLAGGPEPQMQGMA
jgi:hypothetical protein